MLNGNMFQPDLWYISVIGEKEILGRIFSYNLFCFFGISKNVVIIIFYKVLNIKKL